MAETEVVWGNSAYLGYQKRRKSFENLSHARLQLPAFSKRANSKCEIGLATIEAIARYDRTLLLSWQYSFDWRVSTVFSNNFPKASGIAFSIFVISPSIFYFLLFKFYFIFNFLLICRGEETENIHRKTFRPGNPNRQSFFSNITTSLKYETVVLANDVLIAIENGAPTYGVHPYVAYLHEAITGKIVFLFSSA